MFLLPALLSALTLASVLRSAPLAERWNVVDECVTDVKVVSCDEFDCHEPGYHRIDHFLTLSENTTKWNYVFYELEPNQDSSNCITDLAVVAEGGSAPGQGWEACGVSAQDGVTSGGGPTIYAQRDSAAQYAGQVVDLVVIRPGQYANKSEDFIRSPINVGLGDGAGSANYSDWREFDAVSSGWVWLEYTKAGDRPPIHDVQLVSCPGSSIAAECGQDLISQGWNRRDLDLNGPTVNGSHIFLFSSDKKSDDGQCVTGLSVVSESGTGVLIVNVNDGTDGQPVYVQVQRGSGDCLTSILPMATSYHVPLPDYETVLGPDGTPRDLNAGATNAVPINIFTSTKSNFKQQTPSASFNSTGGFRIAHYSDLHLTDIAAICLDVPEQIRQNCSEQLSFNFIQRSLDMVSPDMVIINGDLFAQNERAEDNITYPLNTFGALLKPFFPIIDRGLPFAVTWGNHDAEGNLLREELQLWMSRLPGFIGSRGPAELDGFGNYHVDIAKSSTDDEILHKLWFFDSRAYTFFGNNGSSTGAYGGVHANQVQWFVNESTKDDTPAMAFYHIPLGQISDELGLNSSKRIGVHGEQVCSQGHDCTNTPDLSVLNTGLFEALVSGGNVKATFSGHDHSNDYAISVQNITMTYDGSAGYTAYSTGEIPYTYNREMRVIDILEWGTTATSFKVIDEILIGTVHRNESEPIVTLF